MIVYQDKGKIASGEVHVAMLPKSAGPGSKRRLIILNHGANQSAETAAMLSTPGLGICASLVRAGFAVMSISATGLQHWGNDGAIARLTAAKAWAEANLPVKTDGIGLLGFSMGNLLSLNWARQNVAATKAVASVIGAIDMNDIHDNDRLGSQSLIRTAYGGSEPSGGVYATHSPKEYPADVAAIPQLHMYSSDDPFVLPGITTTFCTAAGATAQSIGAQGHSFGAGTFGVIPRADLVNFFTSRAA